MFLAGIWKGEVGGRRSVEAVIIRSANGEKQLQFSCRITPSPTMAAEYIQVSLLGHDVPNGSSNIYLLDGGGLGDFFDELAKH